MLICSLAEDEMRGPTPLWMLNMMPEPADGWFMNKESIDTSYMIRSRAALNSFIFNI